MYVTVWGWKDAQWVKCLWYKEENLTQRVGKQDTVEHIHTLVILCEAREFLKTWTGELGIHNSKQETLS